MPAPYTFAAKSRAAMQAYILNRTPYYDHHTSFPLSWNVKAHNVDWYHPDGEPINAALDDAWNAYLQANPDVADLAFEDAQRGYIEGEWTSYPGDDSGDWKFGFYGRQGGHLCLEEWRGRKLYGRDFDLQEWLESLSFAELRAFYRGIVTADSDFTPTQASKEVEYHLAFHRANWEAERDAEITAEARSLESTRPDMYASA